MTLLRRPLYLCAALCIASLLLAQFAAAQGTTLTVFGNFRRINHSGDASGQVRLADVPAAKGHWGLGALAGLQGEVLLFDGRMLVSHGTQAQGATSSPQSADQAALFMWAPVQAWDEVAVPTTMTQAEFETFLAKEARSRGLAADDPFVFLLQGRYPQLVWHVVNGAPAHGKTKEPGHANAHAAMHVFDQPAARGWLVGVYSGAQFEGVVSHPGERLHLHYANDALSASGHVDRFSVASGSVLKLPKPPMSP